MLRVLILAVLIALLSCDVGSEGVGEDEYLEAIARADDLERQNTDLHEALAEANERIQNAQQQVENVRLAAESCEEMRFATEALEDIEEVEEP